ncbi:MAG: NAD-dependent DNA ligase LigA, partial [Firmicutes bacterium]|nr:NAD-dependent DNA ligase LigA [Bacillota bacterium]
MDGLTTVVIYKNGEFTQAITRGNGEIGEDITHNARMFANLPMKIPFKGDVTVRGESVISFAEFERINESVEDEEKYKNPRNLCSGTVRQLDNEKVKKRNVCFIAFSLVKAEGAEIGDLKSERLDWLDKMGFQSVIRKKVNRDNVRESVAEFEKGIEKNEFATDGLVLTYDSVSYSQSLGETAKFPRDSIAFKWRDETSETTLRNIIWNTSRTGLINPIAEFDPVELEGTTVSRASLHNVSIVEELELGIGDTIVVYKANMIIPQIAENKTKSGNAVIPDKCAVCGGETEIVKLIDGKVLKCTNPNCRAQAVKSIVHYVSRDAMNIEGFSEASIEKFVENGFIEDFTDIYELKKYEKEITEMEGFGKKSFDNLMNSIEKSQNAQLANFIFALGINHVGVRNAKLLVKRYGSDIEKIMSADEEELAQIEGFGEIIARSVERYFSHEDNIKRIEKALSYLNIEKGKEDSGEKTLENKTFVIT